MTAKLFYAHPKATEVTQLRLECMELERVAKQKLQRYIDVTSGRDHFKAWARALGGWQQWTVEVGSGTGPDGAPLFDAIVVPADTIGRATMQIVEAALGCGRPVLIWDGGMGFVEAVGVVQIGDSWVDGWDLVPRDG